MVAGHWGMVAATQPCAAHRCSPPAPLTLHHLGKPGRQGSALESVDGCCQHCCLGQQGQHGTPAQLNGAAARGGAGRSGRRHQIDEQGGESGKIAERAAAAALCPCQDLRRQWWQAGEYWPLVVLKG